MHTANPGDANPALSPRSVTCHCGRVNGDAENGGTINNTRRPGILLTTTGGLLALASSVPRIVGGGGGGGDRTAAALSNDRLVPGTGLSLRWGCGSGLATAVRRSVRYAGSSSADRKRPRVQNIRESSARSRVSDLERGRSSLPPADPAVRLRAAGPPKMPVSRASRSVQPTTGHGADDRDSDRRSAK